MLKNYLRDQLISIENAKRENRQRVANLIVEKPDLIAPLVDLTFSEVDEVSVKAAWVLEWVCTHNDLDLILPYLDIFTENIHALKKDSAIRPCAKICEHLAVSFTNKKDNQTKHALKEAHIEKIIETGFDWLITPQKIAVRAYTMNTLYLFGLERDWIHPELEHLIRTKIIHESKGCKARGKHILEAIKKHREN